jgi:hypothetical protein
MGTAAKPGSGAAWWRSTVLFALLALVGVAGCASSGSGDGGGPRNALTFEQLSETQEPDVYLAIQRLRPRWLQPRGQTVQGRSVMVFVDGAPRGDVASLSGMQIATVREVAFYSANEAGFRYGTVAGAGGVIEITTRR